MEKIETKNKFYRENSSHIFKHVVGKGWHYIPRDEFLEIETGWYYDPSDSTECILYLTKLLLGNDFNRIYALAYPGEDMPEFSDDILEYMEVPDNIQDNWKLIVADLDDINYHQLAAQVEKIFDTKVP